MTFLLQSLDLHHLDVARDAPSIAVGVSTAAHYACCTKVLGHPDGTPFTPLPAPAAGYRLYLVVLDGLVGSVVIGQLLQHHGLDSPDGYRLGRRLRRLQPHHIGCQ
jgi:hypothetical protein